MICHELGYVKILGNVPLILSFGNSDTSAAAHEALVKNDAALAARFVPDNVRALSYGATSMVFLLSSDALWRQLRVLIGAGFSSGQIRPLLQNTTLVPVANCFLSRFYNRDTVAGINVSKPFVPIAIDPGQM